MTDLISRSELIKVLDECVDTVEKQEHKSLLFAFGEFIKSAPAIDAVPVVHAEWISEIVTKCDWKGRLKQYYQPCSCSACHEPAIRVYNYCSNCGAKMDAKEDD